MATQDGLISYSGKLGNTVGYRRGKKHFNRSLPKEYNLSESSKNSGTEFGHGSTACKLTKTAFAPLMLRPFKRTLHNRLSEIFRKVIRSGPSVMKGQRSVFDGNISLLKGFEFSDKAKLESIFKPSPKINLANGEIKLDFPSFTWDSLMGIPDHAERAVLSLGLAFLDFKNNIYDFNPAPELRIDKKSDFPGGSLVLPISEANELAILVMMTIFFESGTGKSNSKIDNQLYQAGAFLEAIHLRDGKAVIFEQEELPEETLSNESVPALVWSLNQDEK